MSIGIMNAGVKVVVCSRFSFSYSALRFNQSTKISSVSVILVQLFTLLNMEFLAKEKCHTKEVCAWIWVCEHLSTALASPLAQASSANLESQLHSPPCPSSPKDHIASACTCMDVYLWTTYGYLVHAPEPHIYFVQTIYPLNDWTEIGYG